MPSIGDQIIPHADYGRDPLPIVGGIVTVPAEAEEAVVVTLTQNVSVMLRTPPVGFRRLTLIFVQDATGNRTVTWSTPVASAPTVASAGGAMTRVPLLWDNGAWMSDPTAVPGGGSNRQMLGRGPAGPVWRTPSLLGPTFMVVGDEESERYEAWTWLVTTRSGGRMTLCQHPEFSVSGATAASSLNTFMQWQVPTPPAFTVICLGYIDLLAGTVASYIANMKALIAAVEAAGSVPVLATPFPRITGNTATLSRMSAASMWIKNYAALAGHPMVDFYGLLVDPLTGLPKSQYLTSSLYNQVAQRDLADLFITTMAPYMRPWKSIEATWDGDTNNLILNGLTLPDSNADGVPNGWTLQYPGTGSTVSIVTDARFKGGKAIQLAESSPTTVPQLLSPNVGPSVNAGDTLAFTCSYSIESSSGIVDTPETVGLMLYSVCPGVLPFFSYHQVNLASGLNRFTGLTYFPVNSQPFPNYWDRTAVNLMFRIDGLGAGKAMTVRVGDFGIFNLTTMGVVEPSIGYAAGSWNWYNVWASAIPYWLPGS